LLKLPNASSLTSLSSLNTPNRTRSAIEIARFSFIMKNQQQKQLYKNQRPNNSANLLLTSSSLNKYPSNEAWLISNYSSSASRPVNKFYLNNTLIACLA
jgi:hypothetical protein